MILRKNKNWNVYGWGTGAVLPHSTLGLHVAVAPVFTKPGEEVSGDHAVALLISACIYTVFIFIFIYVCKSIKRCMSYFLSHSYCSSVVY